MTPNDTYFSNELYLPLVQAPDAWAITTGTSAVTVAVVGTGIYALHPDLKAKLVPGWNFTDNTSNTNDITGSGTWAAGVIAPSTNNGFGVAGLCWSCRLMPIYVSAPGGSAADATIASGVQWAADQGAKVIYVGYPITDSAQVTTAAQYAWNKGSLVIAPSGNNGAFDASADNPSIVTVGGTDPWTDAIWSLSNTGNNVDLTAPDFSGMTTTLSGYGSDNGGTSNSAAIVSGVAALVWSVNPNLTPAQVTNILKQSADDKGPPGWDSSYGWGRVNALKAVQEAQATLGTSACDVNGDGATTVADVQQDVNQALGIVGCTTGDINKDTLCNVIDVQRVTNAALGGQCVSP